MSSGSLASLDHPTAVSIFTEENRRALVSQINHKAAIVSGIEALAARAIETGDTTEALESIADIAVVLAAEMRKLAVVTGQLQISNAA
ncbi:hypothetical protein [Pseudomonas sp. MF6747]|uniref:hypothetical protein n=1 Tax=Pseudomonas sp. MF6747 TaxID=2797527 RepID=UPI00190DD91B|nr:hypothetical protein [Pseudomonas sp. MF6747]MBK3511293.1 hypothetical protein [Pseudomonas sp. MF6747]